MSRIDVDRWQAAQTAEFSHHQDLRREAYSTATDVIAKYLDFNYEYDFKDKVIVQVGAGPRGSILSTNGNFKRGVVIEPLIDRWPADIREDYEKVGIEIIDQPYENLDIDWLYSKSVKAIYNAVFIHLNSEQTPNVSIIINELKDEGIETEVIPWINDNEN